MQAKEEGEENIKVLSQLQSLTSLSRKQMDCRLHQCAEVW